MIKAKFAEEFTQQDEVRFATTTRRLCLRIRFDGRDQDEIELVTVESDLGSHITIT